MIFKMDTDSVRAMSIQFRRTAEAMEASMASIKQSVTAAPWQSQAREEFIMHLEMMQRSTQESVRVLHLMARAAERKADQWEAIANVFNGPFYYLEGVWDQVKNFMGGLWSGIKNAITSIRLPSLPRFVFPAISGGAIIGGITTLILTWEFKPPSWWPFKKEKHVEQPHTIDEDNQEGNVPTTPAATDVVTEIQPVEPVGLSQNDPNWSGVIMNPKAGGTIGQYGCLLTSVTMIARMKGADVTPIDTNKYLQDHGGYTGKTVKGVYKEGNYMRFDKAAEFLSEQTGKEVTYKNVSNNEINATLEAGQQVIIHVKGNTADGHWVVANGIDPNGNYIVYESGTGKKSTYSPSQLHPNNDSKAFITNG